MDAARSTPSSKTGGDVPTGIDIQMEDEARSFDSSNACGVGRTGPTANVGDGVTRQLDLDAPSEV